MAYIFRLYREGQAQTLKFPLLSIGNFYVGGSGKTPLVMETVEALLDLNVKPILIYKSYKASTQEPLEVQIDSKAEIVGDEALMVKELFPKARVFAGPVKIDTALFAQKKIPKESQSLFILDDGAQHHFLHKDFRIHVWDLSRPLVDLFPFPFGLSREFWFLGEKADLHILNRKRYIERKERIKNLIKGDFLATDYTLRYVINLESKKELQGGFSLISGIGNFKQLENAVKKFSKENGCELRSIIRGADHDSFSWFRPIQGTNYVCTQKDYTKLCHIIDKKNLYVVVSGFDQDFKAKYAHYIKDLVKCLDLF